MVLGKEDFRVTTMDQGLAKEVYSHQCDDDGYSTVLGATMCTDGFYEGNSHLFSSDQMMMFDKKQ